MRVKEARSSLVFIVEDLLSKELITTHTQRMVLHPVLNNKTKHVKSCGGKPATMMQRTT